MEQLISSTSVEKTDINTYLYSATIIEKTNADTNFYNISMVEQIFVDSAIFTSISIIEGVNDVILDPVYEKMVVLGGNQSILGKIINSNN